MSSSSSSRKNSPRAVHQPVMLREVLRELRLEPGLTVVDGTLGAGGHSHHILEKIGENGFLIGTDRDTMMLGLAAQVVQGNNVSLHQGSYALLPQFLEELQIDHVDRVLLDLGLSSDQLADEQRGFSFNSTGTLDLRFDTSSGEPAYEKLSHWSVEELTDIFEKWGEEKFSRQIAAAIYTKQQTDPLTTVRDLVELITDAIPGRFAKDSRKHPATRVFQALRIAVNEELQQLETMLEDVLPNKVVSGGIVVIITFHSLEDRMVKEAFKNKSIWENLTPKPIAPGKVEQKVNPRSRSAKVRTAMRL